MPAPHRLRPHAALGSAALGEDDFRELREHQLSDLSDERLVAYIGRTRAAGRTETMTAAVRVLAFGYWEIIEMRVRLKVPSEDVLEVTTSALESALKAAFDGESTGEFRSWLHTITNRRIADYHRAKEGKPQIVPLPEPGDEGSWGEEPSAEFEGVSIDAERAIAIAMSEMSDVHGQAVDLNVFEDLPAREVAERLRLTEANVHQIKSRFKKRVRELLEEGDTPG